MLKGFGAILSFTLGADEAPKRTYVGPESTEIIPGLGYVEPEGTSSGVRLRVQDFRCKDYGFLFRVYGIRAS